MQRLSKSSFFKNFAEVLMENGYIVGHTAKGWNPGETLNDEGSRRELLGPQYNEFKTKVPTNYINGNDYSKNFEAF